MISVTVIIMLSSSGYVCLSCTQLLGGIGLQFFPSVRAVQGHISRSPLCRSSGKGYGTVTSVALQGAFAVGGRSMSRAMSVSRSKLRTNDLEDQISHADGKLLSSAEQILTY